MKVYVHNDGKEHNESFEATCLDVYAYGANEAEAVAALRNNIERFIQDLQKVNYEAVIYVDCYGNALKTD